MKKEKLKFSVLMSVYKNDNVDYLKIAIDSVINQTLKPNEIVIVQDGPISKELEDVISEYINKYEIIKTVPLAKNQGLGKALNVGLNYCSYDIVARMDADDYCSSDRFEKQIKEFENDDTLSIVGGNLSEFVEDINQSIGIRVVPTTQEKIIEQMKSKNPMNHITVMYKKSDVLKAGNYQDFFYYEDYYLWIRMYLNGMKFKNIDSILAHARVGNGMYKRRGGWKFFKSGVKLQKFMLKNKIINFPIFTKNVLIRFVIQILMPSKIREMVYKKFARK